MTTFQVIILSFFSGSLFSVAIFAMYSGVRDITKYVIDRTHKNYTLVDFDHNGQKHAAKYTREGYQHIFTENTKQDQQ